MRPRVAIAGGGISGLAAAHRLNELGIEPLILESADRLGGMILTEFNDGFLIEGGPDSFLARKPWAAELCRRVGLTEEIIPTDPARRGSFILSGGRLHPLPEGLTSLVPTRLGPLARTRLLSPAGKARLLLEPLVPRQAPGEDASLAEFFRRRLGREASERLVEPLVRGIYGGDPERLSLRATFPQLAEIERRHGSLLRGLRAEARRGSTPGVGASPRSGFLSLRRGMGSLVEALLVRLPAGAVRTKARVESLSRSADGRFELALGSADRVDADAVIVALPPAPAARILTDLDRAAATLIEAVESGASVTVALGYPLSSVGHPLAGHGFVVPASEGGRLLACTWASSKFPGRAPAGAVLLRVFLAQAEVALDQSDGVLIDAVVDALAPLLGLEGPPLIARVHRWPEALPCYAIHHLERVSEIERRLELHPGLFVAGNAYRGIGVPDCVRSGEAAAEAARAYLLRPSSRAGAAWRERQGSLEGAAFERGGRAVTGTVP